MKLSDQDVATINKLLKEHFGIDTITGIAIWRVVWSDDQYEKRLTDCTEQGLLLLTPVVKLLPKYKQWIQQRYILERLVIVPAPQQEELAEQQISYEPIWTFEDKNGNYLPPKYEACEFIIQLIYSVQYSTSKGLKRYVDPLADPENKEKELNKIHEQLFGDESSLMLGTVVGDTVIVPRNYGDDNK